MTTEPAGPRWPRLRRLFSLGHDDRPRTGLDFAAVASETLALPSSADPVAVELRAAGDALAHVAAAVGVEYRSYAACESWAEVEALIITRVRILRSTHV